MQTQLHHRLYLHGMEWLDVLTTVQMWRVITNIAKVVCHLTIRTTTGGREIQNTDTTEEDKRETNEPYVCKQDLDNQGHSLGDSRNPHTVNNYSYLYHYIKYISLLVCNTGSNNQESIRELYNYDTIVTPRWKPHSKDINYMCDNITLVQEITTL